MPYAVTERRLRHFAFAAWALLVLVVGVQTWLAPRARSLVVYYGPPAQGWWHGEDLYGTGLNYLPQFAILFSPFAHLPEPYCGTLWRLFSLAVFLAALLRAFRLVTAQDQREKSLGLILLLALPAAISSVQSGQANLLLAGVMVHAAVALAEARLGLAAFWLVAGVVVKPLGVVMLLLSACVYRGLVPRLAIGLLATALVPFLFGSPEYVARQYQLCLANLLVVLPAEEHRFCDFHGLLKVLGITLPASVVVVMRVAAGLGVLGIWLIGARRDEEPCRARLLLGLSASYLMLFNPMTETNSYVILGPAVAIFAAESWWTERRISTRWSLLLMAVALGCDNYGLVVHQATNLWLKASLTIAFLGYLCVGAGRSWWVCQPDKQLLCAQRNDAQRPRPVSLARWRLARTPES